MSMLILFFILVKLSLISCHGRLINPPARSSCWREFPRQCNTEFTDNQMFCGGKDVQWNTNGGKCGICGDNWSGPRNFELGGKGYTGFIVRRYSSGQTIDVQVELTANHLGWFEFRLCNADALFAQGKDADQDCLDQNLLRDQFGNSRMIATPGIGSTFNYRLILPMNLLCNRCVFQWKYHTGNSWGTNPLTGNSCVGCGPQEEFYGCADVSIRTGFNQEQMFNKQNNKFLPTIKPKTKYTNSFTTKQQMPQSMPQSFLSVSTFEPISNVTFKCPNNGLYANYYRGCNEFFACWHVGTRWESVVSMSCPITLLFDNRLKTCNYAHLVNCNTISYIDFMDNIENYKNLVADLIEEMGMELSNNGLLFTMTIPSKHNLPTNRLKADKVIKNVDYISLGAYDVYGSWDSKVNHHAPLFGNEKYTVDSLVRDVLNYGIPASKLVLGMALYGRTFRIKYQNHFYNKKKIVETGISGKYTKAAGIISYFEICGLKAEDGWRRIWNQKEKTSILVNEIDWIGYEDRSGLFEKTKYLLKMGLAGAMFWDLSMDDFSGQFCNQGKFPLIKTVKYHLQKAYQQTTYKASMKKLKKYNCPKGDGYYPIIESDCQNFYLCTYSNTVHESITHFKCPLGTVFDNIIKTCVYKKNSLCIKRY